MKRASDKPINLPFVLHPPIYAVALADEAVNMDKHEPVLGFGFVL
jgi:hypothetical protein